MVETTLSDHPMTTAILDDVTERIRETRNRLVETTARLVATPAVTGNEAPAQNEGVQFIGGDSGLDERFPNQYYDVPTPTVGPTGGNVHGVDEWADINSLIDVPTLYAHAAIEWCGVDGDSGVGNR